MFTNILSAKIGTKMDSGISLSNYDIHLIKLFKEIIPNLRINYFITSMAQFFADKILSKEIINFSSEMPLRRKQLSNCKAYQEFIFISENDSELSVPYQIFNTISKFPSFSTIKENEFDSIGESIIHLESGKSIVVAIFAKYGQYQTNLISRIHSFQSPILNSYHIIYFLNFYRKQIDQPQLIIDTQLQRYLENLNTKPSELVSQYGKIIAQTISFSPNLNPTNILWKIFCDPHLLHILDTVPKYVAVSTSNTSVTIYFIGYTKFSIILPENVSFTGDSLSKDQFMNRIKSHNASKSTLQASLPKISGSAKRVRNVSTRHRPCFMSDVIKPLNLNDTLEFHSLHSNQSSELDNDSPSSHGASTSESPLRKSTIRKNDCLKKFADDENPDDELFSDINDDAVTNSDPHKIIKPYEDPVGPRLKNSKSGYEFSKGTDPQLDSFADDESENAFSDSEPCPVKNDTISAKPLLALNEPNEFDDLPKSNGNVSITLPQFSLPQTTLICSESNKTKNSPYQFSYSAQSSKPILNNNIRAQMNVSNKQKNICSLQNLDDLSDDEFDDLPHNINSNKPQLQLVPVMDEFSDLPRFPKPEKPLPLEPHPIKPPQELIDNQPSSGDDQDFEKVFPMKSKALTKKGSPSKETTIENKMVQNERDNIDSKYQDSDSDFSDLPHIKTPPPPLPIPKVRPPGPRKELFNQDKSSDDDMDFDENFPKKNIRKVQAPKPSKSYIGMAPAILYTTKGDKNPPLKPEIDELFDEEDLIEEGNLCNDKKALNGTKLKTIQSEELFDDEEEDNFKNMLKSKAEAVQSTKPNNNNNNAKKTESKKAQNNLEIDDDDFLDLPHNNSNDKKPLIALPAFDKPLSPGSTKPSLQMSLEESIKKNNQTLQSFKEDSEENFDDDLIGGQEGQIKPMPKSVKLQTKQKNADTLRSYSEKPDEEIVYDNLETKKLQSTLPLPGIKLKNHHHDRGPKIQKKDRKI